METAAKPPAALWLVVALLLVAGGAIMYGLRGLSAGFAPAVPGTSVAQTPAELESAVLRAAISTNDVAALRALKDKGVDLNAQYQILESGRYPMTPLTFATLQTTPDMVRALLAAGAKPDVASEAGITPLIQAAARSDPATVDALLNAGAPVDAQNKWGQTALMTAARSGNADKVRLLLAAGATAKTADDDGNTAVMWAAGLGGAPEALVVLLEAGADPDVANGAKVTPLMRAAETGDIAKCVALLNAGARAWLKDSGGRTAADWAAIRSDDPGKKCVDLLSRAGS